MDSEIVSWIPSGYWAMKKVTMWPRPGWNWTDGKSEAFQLREMTHEGITESGALLSSSVPRKSKSDFADEDVAEKEDLSVETLWRPKVQQLRGRGCRQVLGPQRMGGSIQKVLPCCEDGQGKDGHLEQKSERIPEERAGTMLLEAMKRQRKRAEHKGEVRYREKAERCEAKTRRAKITAREAREVFKRNLAKKVGKRVIRSKSTHIWPRTDYGRRAKATKRKRRT